MSVDDLAKLIAENLPSPSAQYSLSGYDTVADLSKDMPELAEEWRKLATIIAKVIYEARQEGFDAGVDAACWGQ